MADMLIDTEQPSVAQDWCNCQLDYLNNYYRPRDEWQKALSILVGIYAMIKQHQIMQEYLALAKEQVAKAERYLRLAERHYYEIAITTFNCQKSLWNRYLDDFGSFETRYVADAFRLIEYDPEYKVQEDRNIRCVGSMFDMAARQNARQRGKYNPGFACHDNAYFSIMRVQSQVSAVNHFYRHEENRKLVFDEWYWQRQTAGIGIVDSMGNRTVAGLNQAGQVANQALGQVNNAVSLVQNAFRFVENGYTNLANFWGSVANTAFQFAAYQQGRSNAGAFPDMSQQQQVLSQGQQGNFQGQGFNQVTRIN